MGLTVVDAGVVIGLLDGSDPHHPCAASALQEASDRRDRLILPASGLAEVLVGASRRGRGAVEGLLRRLERVPFRIVPLDQPMATAAAALRASHRSLKLPDALIVATAFVLAADVLLTTDRRWPTAARLGLSSTIQVI